ncbi:MAG: hypothetical protein JWM78_2293 [Verrucomicrobiaceae bacterium]|nr:hypothetical protein [Verrucomicrobiaceae bacterium]
MLRGEDNKLRVDPEINPFTEYLKSYAIAPADDSHNSSSRIASARVVLAPHPQGATQLNLAAG